MEYVQNGTATKILIQSEMVLRQRQSGKNPYIFSLFLHSDFGKNFLTKLMAAANS